MAEPVYLFLKVNGTTIQGDSSQTSLGRADSIECLYYRQAFATGHTSSGMAATGRRTYDPLVIRKRIDKASPLLAKALIQNSLVEGVFKFFRPNPLGDGTTEQFYTTEIKQGRIAAISQSAPEVGQPGALEEQPLRRGRVRVRPHRMDVDQRWRDFRGHPDGGVLGRRDRRRHHGPTFGRAGDV